MPWFPVFTRPTPPTCPAGFVRLPTDPSPSVSSQTEPSALRWTEQRLPDTLNRALSRICLPLKEPLCPDTHPLPPDCWPPMPDLVGVCKPSSLRPPISLSLAHPAASLPSSLSLPDPAAPLPSSLSLPHPAAPLPLKQRILGLPVEPQDSNPPASWHPTGTESDFRLWPPPSRRTGGILVLKKVLAWRHQSSLHKWESLKPDSRPEAGAGAAEAQARRAVRVPHRLLSYCA